MHTIVEELFSSVGGNFMNKFVQDKLGETRNHLVNEITLLNDVQFNSKPDKDKWSIAQVCHHLVLVEEATMKAIAWGLNANEATQQERKNVELILDRTKKLKAPKIVEPAAESFEIQQIIDLLNDSREKMMTKDVSILAEKSVRHPAFGDLPLDQWVELIYLHEQRHIEQIKEIKLFCAMD